MSLDELLKQLKEQGIRIRAEENQLRLRAPKGRLTSALKEEISRHKPALLRRLSASRISRADRNGRLPLSFAQQRVWFLQRQDPQGGTYNVPVAVKLAGHLDTVALEWAFNEIVRRHESLRTTFTDERGQPRQEIHEAMPIRISLLEIGGAGEKQAEVNRLAREEAGEPFDLEKGPLIRLKLLRLGPESHVLLVTLHHIISDGWSMGVIIRELAALYEARLQGRSSPLVELDVQYADFALWQREYLQGEALDRQLSYWKRQMEGSAGYLQMPLDHRRSPARSYRGRTEFFEVEAETVAGLRRLGRSTGCTLFMTLHAAFVALLHRYTQQTDISIGCPIANRNRGELEPLIGFFVNTLVLRTDLSGDPTFQELSTRTQRAALEAYEHQDLPFERLVDELQSERDLSRNPLFQVMFALQNTPQDKLQLSGLTASLFTPEVVTSKFDLFLSLKEEGEGLSAYIEYSEDLFKVETIRRLFSHYRTLLRAVANDPEIRVSDLTLVSEEEQRRAMEQANGNTTDYPREASVVDLFEQEVRRRSGATALTSRSGNLSYDELNGKANQLARFLRSQANVRPGGRVAIHLDRSNDLMVALLGVLKAGAAFVPLDLAYPEERLRWMLEDARPEAVLASSEQGSWLEEAGCPVIWLDRQRDEIAAESVANPGLVLPANAVAYIMYTSGSTGNPKGVAVPHRAITRLVRNSNFFTVAEDDVFLQMAPVSFDASTFEIWASLLNGARLAIMPPGTPALDDICQAIREYQVTVLWLTAGLFRVMVDERLDGLAGVRQLLAGGDILPLPQVERVLEALPDCQLINGYGPTENTTFTCCYPVRREGEWHQSVPIGSAISNTRVYVVDERLRPVPVGISGELLTGGDGLAQGYHGRPSLTAERFVPDPLGQIPGERLYRTGDRVRQLADGSIEFLGRVDRQIKLRGFRIELGEIEAALREAPGVRESAVICRDEGLGEKQLLGFVTLDSEHADEALDQQAIEAEQVEHWRALYEETYVQESAGDDPTFNIQGWNSTFTGEPLPPEQMREWLEGTVARIEALPARRVLEIGCGTGLLLFRIAPRCEAYVGTDFSPAALDYVERQRGRLGGLDQVELLQRPAEVFEGWEENAVDLVILNSIVQYFPDVDYLARVLEGATRVVRPGGHIFIGDVRNLDSLERFHASVELTRTPDLTSARLRRQARQRAQQERELVLAPDFFGALVNALPKLTGVSVRFKQGRSDNELLKFRYDAVLEVAHDGEPDTPAIEWREWNGNFINLDDARRFFAEGGASRRGIRRLPNRRLDQERTIDQWLNSNASAEAPDLDAMPALEGLAPQDLWELGTELGGRMEVAPSPGSWSTFDVVFSPDASDRDRRIIPGLGVSADVSAQEGWQEFVNRPLHGARQRELSPMIAEALREKLPAYMVPSSIVVLDEMPLTKNGKIDRAALPAQEYEALTADYSPPTTEAERTIARIFSDVLGVSRVGVHDNFFELGGDSIISIQIAARANEAGYKFTTRSLFEHQSVAELARWATCEAAGPAADQGEVTGEVPLTPIQRWFLERSMVRPSRFCLGVTLEVPKALTFDHLREALLGMVRHHDGLRTRMARTEDGGWNQSVDSMDARDCATAIMALEPPAGVATKARVQEWLRVRVAELLEGMDLERGPLFRAAWLPAGEDRPACLVWLIHHLVVDGVSWRILIEDLITACGQAQDGRPVALPAKTLSFRDWAEALQKTSSAAEILASCDHWKNLHGEDFASLPRDRHPESEISAVAQFHLGLEIAATETLSEAVSQMPDVQLHELLIAALALCVKEWTNRGEPVWLQLEGHGREEEVLELDVSRTVGWFTSLFPVALCLPDHADDHEALRSVSRQLNAVPHRGMSFGMLKYLSGDREVEECLRGLPSPEVSFNYLGRLSPAPQSDFRWIENSDLGTLDGDTDSLMCLIDVNVAIVGGRLRSNWTYDSESLDESTVRRLAERWLERAQELAQTADESDDEPAPAFGDLEIQDDDLMEMADLARAANV